MSVLEQIAAEKLAISKFTEAEQRLLTSASKGDFAWCGASPDYWHPDNVPYIAESGATSWGADRTVRADLLKWLISDPRAAKYISPNGILLGGAKIDETLCFSQLSARFPLVLVRCRILRGVELFCARIPSLDLAGSLIEPLVDSPWAADGTVSIFAVRLITDGHVLMGSGFIAKGEVNLTEAHLTGDLDCAGGRFDSQFRALTVCGAKIERNVLLGARARARVPGVDPFFARGEINLATAQVGGNLDCRGGHFFVGRQKQPGLVALRAAAVKVGGSVLLRHSENQPAQHFCSDGEVNLDEAQIEGDLNCGGGSFQNPDQRALVVRGTRIHGSVFLHEGLVAAGEVDFVATEIGGSFDCTGAILHNPQKRALKADGIKVGRRLSLRCEKGLNHPRPFCSQGEVSLEGAQVGGSLECTGAHFFNPQGKAINAARIRVADKLLLDEGFEAKGEVCLRAAQINGSVVCAGGRFENHAHTAIHAHMAKIEGSVAFGDDIEANRNPGVTRPFEAIGKVDLIGAQVGGFFSCENAVCDEGISARLLSVRADASFKRAQLAGPLDLRFASIGGSLDFENATIRDCVDLRSITVKETLSVQGARMQSAKLDVRRARAGTLEDNRETEWPAGPASLLINGFVYESLHSSRLTVPEGVLGWLQLGARSTMEAPVSSSCQLIKLTNNEAGTSRSDHKLQPYKQIAKVLSKMGHEDLARDILIAKERSRVPPLWLPLRHKYSEAGENDAPEELSLLRKLGWNALLPLRALWRCYMRLVGFWYKPLRAVEVFGALVAIGVLLCYWGQQGRYITPTDESAYDTLKDDCRTAEYYEQFNSLIYSIEIALPFVNLRQKEKWAPHSEPMVCGQPAADPTIKGYLESVTSTQHFRDQVHAVPIRVMGVASETPTETRNGEAANQNKVALVPLLSAEHNIPISLPSWFGMMLRAYLWLQTILGWLLAATFVAGVSGLVHDKGEGVREHAD
ncbi:MAG: hypothetical protein JO166_12285 [Deltaproteobacteria bacterium]|nr:hypothetical protein [Deltaproteobacteria bacterium]